MSYFYSKEVATLAGKFNYRPDRELKPAWVPEGARFGLVWLASRTAEVDEQLAVVEGLLTGHPKHLMPVRRALNRELKALLRARRRLSGEE